MTLPLRGEVTQNFEIYGVKTVSQLEELARMGFTRVVLETHSLAVPASQLGLESVLANWFSPETDWEAIRPIAENAGRLPKVVSFNLMDEPIHNGSERFPPDYYIALREKLKSSVPQLKLSITEYGPQPSWDSDKQHLFERYLGAIDMLRIDPYPIAGGRPLRAVYDWMALARLLMHKNHLDLPLTVILQAWNSGDSEHPEMPAIEQLRVMAYLAFFTEADAISFFDYNEAVWHLVPGFKEGVADLVRELKGMSVHYRGWKVTSAMSSSGVFTAELQNDGFVETYTVNTQDLVISKTSNIQ